MKNIISIEKRKMTRLCKCGCGKKIINQYHHKYYGIPNCIRGHQKNFLGKHHTEESKQKIRKKLKGRKLSIETKKKISLATTGKIVSKETRKKISQSSFGKLGTNLGRKFSKEWKRKIGLGNTGKKHSKKTKLLIGKNNARIWLGKKRPNIGKKISKKLKGIKRTKEQKRKISKTLIEKHKKGLIKINYNNPNGKNAHNWQGGLSFEPYSYVFNTELKIKIRKLYDYTCQLCYNKENGRKHSAHHIDYNKKNNNINNLILLCVGCNSKVNGNRKSWTKYFNNYTIGVLV